MDSAAQKLRGTWLLPLLARRFIFRPLPIRPVEVSQTDAVFLRRSPTKFKIAGVEVPKTDANRSEKLRQNPRQRIGQILGKFVRGLRTVESTGLSPLG